MKQVRAVYRLIIFFLLSVIVLITSALGSLFSFGNTKRRIRWKNFVVSYWAAGVARVIGCTITINGQLPESPFFMVSNHLSYIDILPFWKHLNTTFIAKSDIKEWPFFGNAARLLGIIFIDRQKRKDLARVNKLIKQRLDEQEGILLFPEGTSSKGAKVLPFRSSLLFYPAEQQIPVYFASISYSINGESSARAWKNICWWGDMDFFSHFWQLLQIKAWQVNVHFGSEAISSSNRKELSKRLHKKVTENFTPTYKR